MTREEAEKRAAALTASGVLTRVGRDARKPGGFVTRNLAAQRASDVRRAATDKRKAARVRYNARTKLGRRDGLTRLGRDGERLREVDLLRAEQKGRCLVCLAIVEFLGIDLYLLAARVDAALKMPWLSMSPDEVRRARRRARAS